MLFNYLLSAAAEGGATTGDANTPAQGGLPGWAMWVIIGVVLVLMIALTIIPQKKRQKEQQNMMNSLAVGTKLMTVGGLVGKITQVNADNTLIINVGTEENPTLIVIDRKAVGYVLENVNPPAPVVEDAPVDGNVDDAPQEPAAEDVEVSDDAFDMDNADAQEEVAPATDDVTVDESEDK